MGSQPGRQPLLGPGPQNGIGSAVDQPTIQGTEGGVGPLQWGLEAAAPDAIGRLAQSRRQALAAEHPHALGLTLQGVDPGLRRQGLQGRPEGGGRLAPATLAAQQLGGGERVPAQGRVLPPAAQLQRQGRLQLALARTHLAEQVQGAGMAGIQCQAAPEGF